jgi:hypothetical protein
VSLGKFRERARGISALVRLGCGGKDESRQGPPNRSIRIPSRLCLFGRDMKGGPGRARDAGRHRSSDGGYRERSTRENDGRCMGNGEAEAHCEANKYSARFGRCKDTHMLVRGG